MPAVPRMFRLFFCPLLLQVSVDSVGYFPSHCFSVLKSKYELTFGIDEKYLVAVGFFLNANGVTALLKDCWHVLPALNVLNVMNNRNEQQGTKLVKHNADCVLPAPDRVSHGWCEASANEYGEDNEKYDC